MKYTYIIPKDELDDAIFEPTAQNDDNPFKLFKSVYAVDIVKWLDNDESVKRFLQFLIKIEDDVNDSLDGMGVAKGLVKSHIGKVISKVGNDFKNLSTDDLRTLVKQQKSAYIVAQIVAYHVAGESDELMRALRRFSCTRGGCDLGGAFQTLR
ncbi:hypothetical protein [Gynuella sunshinyii]|uniref:Uncharacterized protein n=1 Tax=Gynuella sunshinyii YC6258 TaxID=1445510 RepID=A0A0C5VRG8_9GAMM|nr:hypothetical protein [Gynuella sunshinyii]AJQ92849.1 hypothetical Protein YC6258_00799 [Gynuella sunshinyii YC6258]